MVDYDYLEKILGEQYDMSDYFDNTHTESAIKYVEPVNNISKKSNDDIVDSEIKEVEKIENEDAYRLRISDQAVETESNENSEFLAYQQMPFPEDE